MANLLTKEEFLSLLRKNRKPNEIESSEEEIVKVKKTRVKGTLKKEKTKENNKKTHNKRKYNKNKYSRKYNKQTGGSLDPFEEIMIKTDNQNKIPSLLKVDEGTV